MKTITINGQRWKIRFVNRLGIGKDKLAGDCDYEQKIIRIVRGQSERETIGTLLHEVVHAACPYLTEETVLALESAQVAALEAIRQ